MNKDGKMRKIRPGRPSGIRSCSGCKAWNSDDVCEFGYKQKTDPFHGVGPDEACPKPKYVFEYNEMKADKVYNKRMK